MDIQTRLRALDRAVRALLNRRVADADVAFDVDAADEWTALLDAIPDPDAALPEPGPGVVEIERLHGITRSHEVGKLTRERNEAQQRSAQYMLDCDRAVTRAQAAEAEIARLKAAGKDLAKALGAAMSYSQFDGLPQAERTRCLEALVAWANATGLGVVGREAQDVLRGGV